MEATPESRMVLFLMLEEALVHRGFGAVFCGLRWNLGDENSTKIWEDNWVLSLRNFCLSSPKTPQCDFHLVSDLFSSFNPR